MRRPAERINRGRKARTYSVPGPTRGWNARDGLASMRPGDAVLLQNWFPTPSNVQVRKGSLAFTTGLGTTQVETLASYKPSSGTNSLWAWAGTSLYNSTTPGAMPAATVTGLTNARWQTTNCTTVGGNFLVAVNGADKLLLYDGSTWKSIDNASTPNITGVATTALASVNIFKSRAWYVENSSYHIWYSAVGAFAGALTLLDLSPVFKKGGFLVAMDSWTLDGGEGPDDLAVFITSQGEVAVYQGIDPSSANSWALVGVYNIGQPVGKHPFIKYKGDLCIITNEGLLPASKALVDEQSTTLTALTDRISGAVSDAATKYFNNFGWQIVQYPNGGMLVMNVPVSVGQQQQYVMNSTTGAWCNFTGWAANCFEIHNGDLFFGTAGGVTKAWTGTSDNGMLVTAELIGAYDYFKNRNGTKEITLFRPVIGWDFNPATFLVGVNVDFNNVAPTGAIAFPVAAGGIWDSGTWDGVVWGGDVKLNSAWYSAFGIGFAIAPHIIVASNTSAIEVAAFDYAYKQGAIL